MLAESYYSNAGKRCSIKLISKIQQYKAIKRGCTCRRGMPKQYLLDENLNLEFAHARYWMKGESQRPNCKHCNEEDKTVSHIVLNKASLVRWWYNIIPASRTILFAQANFGKTINKSISCSISSILYKLLLHPSNVFCNYLKSSWRPHQIHLSLTPRIA